MNGKNLVLLALAILVVGLGVALVRERRGSVKLRTEYDSNLGTLSKELKQTEIKWIEQTNVNSSLDAALEARRRELEGASNRVAALVGDLAVVSGQLATVRGQARETSNSLVTAQSQIQERDARIGALEGERDDLTRRMEGLNGRISGLEGRIVETQQKLARSEGDREFLLKELQRLQAEKAELERQFNDLAILREQVRKLREELSIARRIEWIRRGLFGTDVKAGERMQLGVGQAPKTNFNLDAEIRRGGEAAPAVPNQP